MNPYVPPQVSPPPLDKNGNHVNLFPNSANTPIRQNNQGMDTFSNAFNVASHNESGRPSTYNMNISPIRQISQYNNSYNIPPIAQDLAPRMNVLANDIYYNSKKGFDQRQPLNSPASIGKMNLESQRNLVDKFSLPISTEMIQAPPGRAEIPAPIAPVQFRPQLQQNSCFYSCCPIQCCRCRHLAYTCRGCCSETPRMPGGGCCGCLGLSPSAGMAIPPPGVLPPTYEAPEYSSQGFANGICQSCCGGFSSQQQGATSSLLTCCGCCNCCACLSTKLPYPNEGHIARPNITGLPLGNGLGSLPPRSIYQNPSWLPPMGSEVSCCYCC